MAQVHMKHTPPVPYLSDELQHDLSLRGRVLPREVRAQSVGHAQTAKCTSASTGSRLGFEQRASLVNEIESSSVLSQCGTAEG